MSTYRYRGDLRTTGDQLRLRESGTETNKKPVEIKANDNNEEVILKSPANAEISSMPLDGLKRVDTLVAAKATQALENKTINADINTISELEVDNLKDGVLIDSSELVVSETDNLGESSGGNHIPADADNTMLLSASAIKVYVDARDAEQDEASETIYDNTTSGLTATNVQDAIDEVEGRLDTAETGIVNLGNDKVDKTTTVTGDELSTTGGGDLSTNRVITLRDNPIIPGTESMTLPGGTDGDRPSVPAAGMVRYNTGTKEVEKYDGAEWSQVGGGGLKVFTPSPGSITADVSAHYVLDTALGTYTVTLPDSALITEADKKKATIRITDAGENAQVNNITINRSGSDVIDMGGDNRTETSIIFDISGTWIQLVLKGSTWVVDDVFWNVIENLPTPSDFLSDEIVDGVTDKAPTQNAVFDALALKADKSTTYTKTELDGGQLNTVYYTKSDVDSLLFSNQTADRNRANHLGTQLAITISDFQASVSNNTNVVNNTLKISADGSINTHSDVAAAGAQVGNTLIWNGTQWVPGVAGAQGEVFVHTGNGHGSSATKIRRFSTTEANTGTSITYADSATAGASFTINEDGLYSIAYSDSGSSEIAIGVSETTASTSTNIEARSMAEWACPVAESIQTNVIISTSATIRLSSGAIIRPHTNGNPDAEYGASFRITQVAKL